MSKREYEDYIQDISDAINAIEQFTRGMTKNEFLEDLKTVYAVRKAIEIIGEATKRVPKAFKDKHPDIPWRKMTGMRDRLIHEYFGVKLNVLWETIQIDIPQLKILVAGILQELGEESKEPSP